MVCIVSHKVRYRTMHQHGAGVPAVYIHVPSGREDGWFGGHWEDVVSCKTQRCIDIYMLLGWCHLC